MQVVNERPDRAARTIDNGAALLGLHEFSLLSRIQAGEIKSARARSGEMLIPETELARLAPNVRTAPRVDLEAGPVPVSDEKLGIKKAFEGLRQNGEHPARFTVPGYGGQFTTGEMESYRAAFRAIASELESATGLREQLKDASGLSDFAEAEIESPQIGRWEIRAKLLTLGKSDILLGQRADGEFAVIERFRPESLYGQHSGGAEILLQGDDPVKLNRDFTANARLTLEFMASNLTAKAQKIVWEQFPDHRPGHVVAAITERCHQAIANEETVSQNRRVTRSISGGIGV
jgi:hypothetical protein